MSASDPSEEVARVGALRPRGFEPTDAAVVPAAVRAWTGGAVGTALGAALAGGRAGLILAGAGFFEAVGMAAARGVVAMNRQGEAATVAA